MKDIVAVTAILLIVCVGALFVRLDKIDSEDGFDWLNHNIRSEECATDIVSGEIYDMNSTDTFNLSDYSIYIEEYATDIVLGEIKSENTAVEKAGDIFRKVYGESVESKKPYIVFYDKEHDAWFITGTLPAYYLGGVPNVIIHGEDGRVLALWHTK